ncbi:hypothetical protein GIB67_032106 [Kingdonia uniflora]|uniref:RNase H type-1 domain-containing protein n=1 Tax=Kingdonia uniflora TaxID=39325 RepID=A0A7J7MWP0_9MAGN|nr:hypothetical protein GIB67_032106 [Kingdonia uniflora]
MKKPEKNEQDKLGLEKAADGLKKVDKQKEMLKDKMPSTTQPIQPHKTFKGVVELWDRTIRNWDGLIHSQEVDKEASMVNKSWADMVEEADSAILVNTEEFENEESSGSESHGSEFSSNFGNRGIANLDTSNLLKDVMKSNFPNLFCIMEPKVTDVNKLRRENFSRWKGRFYSLIVVLAIEIFGCCGGKTKGALERLAVIGSSNLPWIMVGDFNIVLRAGEKKGGRGLRWRAVEEFQDFVQNSCLLEANSSGSEYTWCNGKMGNNRILCKLDRMLCNKTWSNLFPGWKYKVMARMNSDHSPLFGWNGIGSKLRHLKSRLKEYNILVFGHNKQHIQELSARVEALQLKLESEIENDDAARDLTKANQLLTSAVNNDEDLWKQKARVNWLQSGDRNTAYFHGLARIKRNKSLIHSIQTEDGRTLEDQDEIKTHIVDFFYEFFSFKAHPKLDLVLNQELPRIGKIKINTNGAAKGNLGNGGIGCIFQDCNGFVLGTLSKGLGLVTNFMAECEVIIHGVEHAASFGWLIAWIESDSTTAVEAFKTNNIP